MHPEDDVIAAIDELERDEIDDLVDWQMSESPAAKAGRSAKSWPVGYYYSITGFAPPAEEPLVRYWVVRDGAWEEITQ